MLYKNSENRSLPKFLLNTSNGVGGYRVNYS